MERRFAKQSYYLLMAIILLCCVVSSCVQKGLVTADSKKMDTLKHFFDSMEAQGVDTTQPFLYGYFFYDNDLIRLKPLHDELVKQNYAVVRMEKNEDGESILHVERVEVHSSDSLRERERELKALASRFSVETYDGFDMGNVDPSKPLVSNESFQQFMNSKQGNELFDLGKWLYDLEVKDRASQVLTECIKQKIKPEQSQTLLETLDRK